MMHSINLDDNIKKGNFVRMKIETEIHERKVAIDKELGRQDDAFWKAYQEGEGASLAIVKSRVMEGIKPDESLTFHNSMMASRTRLIQGSPKPIDILRMLFRTTDDLQDLDCSTQLQPYNVFQGLGSLELENLLDIKFELHYVSRLEATTGIMRQCWEALRVVCEGELFESKIEESGAPSEIKDYAYMRMKLQNKDYTELEHLQWKIEMEMAMFCLRFQAGKNQRFCQLIQFFKAKIFLEEIQGCQILGKRLILDDNMPPEEVDPPIDNLKILIVERQGVIGSPYLSTQNLCPVLCRSVADFLQRASISMDAAASKPGFRDPIFNKEVNIESRAVYEWSDEYLPRRPYYSNRVRWDDQFNAYNEVTNIFGDGGAKGYMFNIFYPDLVDKRNLQYFIENDGDSTETCIIRFQGGPPYKDVAFRIVNKEWELKGFKSTFN